MLGKVTDPVCKMKLKQKETTVVSHYDGKDYYFCSEICQKYFDDNHKKYTKERITDIPKRLERLVHGVLSYAKPSNLDKQEHHFIDLIDSTLQRVKNQAEESRVKIAVDYKLEQQSVVLDGEKIKQVLVNLLDNGLAFSPEGGKIALKAFADQKWVTIEVADAGPGIPPELLDSIFTPFVSARKNRTGLGLAIAKRIISDHGGEIWAENRRQGGALFGFKIPLRQSCQPKVLISGFCLHLLPQKIIRILHPNLTAAFPNRSKV